MRFYVVLYIMDFIFIVFSYNRQDKPNYMYLIDFFKYKLKVGLKETCYSNILFEVVIVKQSSYVVITMFSYLKHLI